MWWHPIPHIAPSASTGRDGRRDGCAHLGLAHEHGNWSSASSDWLIDEEVPFVRLNPEGHLQPVPGPSSITSSLEAGTLETLKRWPSEITTSTPPLLDRTRKERRLGRWFWLPRLHGAESWTCWSSFARFNHLMWITTALVNNGFASGSSPVDSGQGELNNGRSFA